MMTLNYCNFANILHRIKNEVKTALSDFVWKETQRRPMIMPVIMEV